VFSYTIQCFKDILFRVWGLALRAKRLLKDLQSLIALDENSDLIKVNYQGNPPERYRVIYFCKSLIWIEGNGAPSFSGRHELEIYLHKDYPRRPPALKWHTNIFHPNILPPQKNGGVCIGSWTAAETLDKLCLRIGEMLQYKSYNITDPLDEEAAKWVKQHLNILPVDNRSLL
jgi:ubiquitin-protein ligase